MEQQTLSIRHVDVTRYVTPLREGGSMPAIAEADDGFLYAIKFRGAGQGPKALIAELIGGEIARHLQLKIPEIVFAQIDSAFGRTEPDEEIQDLLRASEGLNLGLHYLSGAITYDPAVTQIDSVLASKIVWLDSLITNVDRTCRNTNMLWWQHQLWLIDHGAALYFHHNWGQVAEQAVKPFLLIKDHVLLPQANDLQQIDSEFKPLFTDAVLDRIVATIPVDWLLKDAPFETESEHRGAYALFLKTRIRHSQQFVNEAIDARKNLI